MVYITPGLFLTPKKTRVRKLSRKSPRSVTCRYCGYNSVLSVKVQAGAFSQVLLLQLYVSRLQTQPSFPTIRRDAARFTSGAQQQPRVSSTGILELDPLL